MLSCNSPKITDNDIIGVWIADDNAVFEIKNDNTLIFSNVSNKMFGSVLKNINRNFSGSGTWKLTQMKGECIIETSLHTDSLKGGFSTRFDITGTNWLGNKPPWYLFTFIGDPDNNERYSFYKREQSKDKQ